MDETGFYRAVEEWVDHCGRPAVRLSSSPAPITDCDAYRRIVAMGREALPLIRSLYDRDCAGDIAFSMVQGHGLVSLVGEIVGADFSVPEDISGRMSALKDYTKSWLDEQIDA